GRVELVVELERLLRIASRRGRLDDEGIAGIHRDSIEIGGDAAANDAVGGAAADVEVAVGAEGYAGRVEQSRIARRDEDVDERPRLGTGGTLVAEHLVGAVT